MDRGRFSLTIFLIAVSGDWKLTTAQQIPAALLVPQHEPGILDTEARGGLDPNAGPPDLMFHIPDHRRERVNYAQSSEHHEDVVDKDGHIAASPSSGVGQIHNNNKLHSESYRLHNPSSHANNNHGRWISLDELMSGGHGPAKVRPQSSPGNGRFPTYSKKPYGQLSGNLGPKKYAYAKHNGTPAVDSVQSILIPGDKKVVAVPTSTFPGIVAHTSATGGQAHTIETGILLSSFPVYDKSRNLVAVPISIPIQIPHTPSIKGYTTGLNHGSGQISATGSQGGGGGYGIASGPETHKTESSPGHIDRQGDHGQGHGDSYGHGGGGGYGSRHDGSSSGLLGAYGHGHGGHRFNDHKKQSTLIYANALQAIQGVTALDRAASYSFTGFGNGNTNSYGYGK